ncbi:MAG: hypothetical protein QM708_05805 [Propioniciclava sp.]|uniref:hypothetical protein n=1 Tax=Propioniciclava sp. TaxID=2038686 RepID=UPI0039E575E9
MWISAVVAAGVLLSGCGAGPAPAEPDASARPISTGGGIIPEPFAAVLATVDEHARDRHDRVEAETVRCMAAQGFTYTPLPFWQREQRFQRFGDIEHASRYGFGLSPEEDRRGRQDSLPDDTAKLSSQEKEAWFRALLGDMDSPNRIRIEHRDGSVSEGPGEGCDIESQQALYGDYRAWRVAQVSFEELDHLVRQGTDSDPAWQRALADWRSCMTDAGYARYATDSRVEASELLSEEHRRGRVYEPDTVVPVDPADAKHEREVAVASATCEKKLGMADTYARVQAVHEKKVSETEQGVITGYLELVVTGTAKAGGEVEASPSTA